ncbi:hypothetical protein N473_26740 [Pseudoalteromonas luteoviolacea CPMOR-1]|uniref:Uncharacterized protein n=1 Tax=Pseudoalteromonas luteoviolacea CPMOR-1 TaxID=1365248 RepID=A0A167GZ39_9GAMM|nr:hypothetical protein [Pseudoalteromonas luteoviolacea]KZN57457.1 hypothetical protein N473_26740 [Pseudoalteromonas luteoviolacea CPMOR-1]
MTTIIYDHKNSQIACDSQTTENGIIINSDADKWYILSDGSLIFATGKTVDIHELRTHLEGGELSQNIGKVIYFRIHETHKTVIYGSVYETEDKTKVVREEPLLHSYGIGSGGESALVALSFNVSARDAVIKASEFDINTNDNVKVYDISEVGFI